MSQIPLLWDYQPKCITKNFCTLDLRPVSANQYPLQHTEYFTAMTSFWMETCWDVSTTSSSELSKVKVKGPVEKCSKWIKVIHIEYAIWGRQQPLL